MKTVNKIIHAMCAVCAASAACIFSLCYNGIKAGQAHRVEAKVFGYHGVRERLTLPSITSACHDVGVWIFFVPIAVMVVGLLCVVLGKRRSWPVVLVTCVGWLFALSWPLTCIIAWELSAFTMM